MKSPTPLVALVVSLLLALACATASAQEVQELTPLQPVVPPVQGTFFFLKNRSGPPYPFDPSYGLLDVYEWRRGVFLVDDTDWPNAGRLTGGFETLSSDTLPYPCTQCPTNSEGGGPTSWGENFSYAGSNVLWLEIINLTNGTGKVVLHRPTGDRFDYDLITKTNIDPVVAWSWLTNLNYSASNFVSTITNTAQRFFYAKRIPDLDGDGLRDYWEWGGTPPGSVVIDDDRDNDGIPDSIEIVSGSATNDPASLPPPSLYVSVNGPASGADGSLDLPFRDLQTAINAATNFSVVLVKAGAYSGASNRNLSFGAKKLVLVSERGWESTIIDAGDGTNRAFAFLSTTQDYHLQVIGFTITNAGAGAVACTAASAPTFVNCRFIGNSAGAVLVTNASPVFVGCQFLTNATAGNGAAIYATGSGSTVRVSHSSFRDNVRANGGGQVYAAGSATVTLNNSIVWGVRTDLGNELVTSGGTITAQYCDVRGGYSGTGNLNTNPLFEAAYGARLSVDSPCIDQGVVDGLPGFALFTQRDADNEARLDHAGFANTFSTVDIGADEYVYRLQFPTVLGTNWVLGTNGLYVAQTNYVSEVDEASGVASLGTNAIGPVIAIVDDEDRRYLRVYQLNPDASAIVQPISLTLSNTAYTGGDAETTDMEGLTFDPATRQLYLVTSQTKRNRYRNVDSTPPIADPVIDPPYNDYDRRRAALVRVTFDATLTNQTARTYFESEEVPVPYNTGYNATNGLAAWVRNQLTNNAALRETNRGNKVLIAWNTVNKFGTPKNGVSYSSNTALPYVNGGTTTTAGTSLGFFDTGGTSGTNSHVGRTPGATYFYKIWAVDAQTNYFEGPVGSATTTGRPLVYINEFDAAGTNETLEFYNPSPVAVNIGGCFLSDDLGQPTKFPIPAGTTVPARGLWTISNYGFNFADSGNEDIFFRWTNTVILEQWNMRDPDQGSVDFTQGRVWDGGPRGFVVITQDFDACLYRTLTPQSPYPPNLGGLNHAQARKYLDAVADVNQTNVYLMWQNIGVLPSVERYSPKQHDFHSINFEDIAFRNTNEMVLGLRAPLVNRTTGNAYYFVATNLSAFLPANGWTTGQLQGISGVLQMNLGGLGVRSIKWCPNGLTNGSGQAVQRYLVLAGTANGGPLQRENARQRFALYAWDGSSSGGVANPQLLISDLVGYAVRPEGIEIINVNGVWRILFVEDRFLAPGYATRNAVHWPVQIVGPVQ